MILILHLIFAASAGVYIWGGWLDYHNSLGRGEQTQQFQDEKGYFDPAKFKRVQIRDFIIITAATLLFELLLSRVSPDYAYGLLLGIGAFLFIGIRGMVLSRR